LQWSAHTGTLFGIPPTGHAIDVRQMQIEWLRDGRICRHWRITDEHALLQQLGVASGHRMPPSSYHAW